MAAAPGSSKQAVAASVDPRDYQWGPLNMSTQQQLFAQFMSMTQMALMCGCALLPPPGLCPPAPVGAAAPPLVPPPPAFAPFWPPGRPPLAAPVPLPPGIPQPDKPASPAPPTTPAPATPRGPSPAPDLALAKAASAPAPSLARATSCASPKASNTKKRGAANNKSGTKTTKATPAPAPSQLPVPPPTPGTAHCMPLQSGSVPGLPGSDSCALDPDHDMRLLEALPLDLDDIRQLFQEDLAQELEHHDSLSAVSQGSHNTCFAAAADAAATAAAAAGSPSPGDSVHLTGGTSAGCPSKELLVESLDGPLSLASFDQSFEQLSSHFKSLSNSFDALHDLGDILDVNMDEDFVAPIVPASLAPAPSAAMPALTGDDLMVALAGKAGAAAKKQEVCQKALKVNKGRGSNSGITKSRASMDKGAGKASMARGGSGTSATLVDAPMEELLEL